ncbi:hypothetical protein B0A55_02721 [Friedmanniomyces simplex]|uniref:Major facilitator superfamily (MFS) profile domain-containing protein n=1 Tax=Friedmanniomyces simplex TaxID=329884 RepID=A0A4U0XLH0_9PEZI|nr:hypothetical protein B0A55_02721 [Friedmanniomyces simplex]
MAWPSRLKPAGYTIASLAVSLGGILNGYDTGSVGAVVTMPQFTETMGEISPSLLGFTVSVIMFAGAIPSFFSGPPADRYGRVAVVAAGAVSFAIGAVLQASAQSLAQFITGRVFAGAGEGLFLGVMNVYICEISPSARRGSLASMPQLFSVLAMCGGYFTAYGSVKIQSSIAWRLPFVLMAIIAVALVITCYFLPPSPRWLVLQGRHEEAVAAVERLGIQQAEAEKDILRIRDEDVSKMHTGFFHSLKLIWARQYRSRTILALFILGMVQLCGIDGVMYYAPTLFAQAGLPENTAGFLASGLSGILIVVISIPAAILADKWGRRTSVIVGGVLLSGFMFLMGVMYAARAVHHTGAGRWVVIISIFSFALSYAATWAFVGKIYASEIQSGQTRAACNAVAQGLNFFTNGVVALITPILLAKSAYGAYFLFGGLSFGTLVVLALYMPETRGEPLESIQEVFSKPLQRHGVEKLLHRRLGSSQSTVGWVSGRASRESRAVELDELSRMHAATVRALA